MAVLKELGLGGTTAWRVRRRAYMLPFARRRRGAAGVSVWCPTAPKGPERWRARGVWVRGVNSASNGSNEAFDSHTASFLSRFRHLVFADTLAPAERYRSTENQ